MEMMLNKIAPEDSIKYTHTCEGPDDMPAHVKSTVIGSEITIPIHNGKLTLGRWQVWWSRALFTSLYYIVWLGINTKSRFLEPVKKNKPVGYTSNKNLLSCCRV